MYLTEIVTSMYWGHDNKGDQDGVFITENLTKYRTELVKRLSQLKFHRQIYTYWTSDGRIYVKKLETSRKQLVTNFEDIETLNVQYMRKHHPKQLTLNYFINYLIKAKINCWNSILNYPYMKNFASLYCLHCVAKTVRFGLYV